MIPETSGKTELRYILAIETAVGHGSAALLDRTDVIAQSDGTTPVRAENLLASVTGLLSFAGVLRRDVGLIAVSKGPGSFTGIRIGLAFAKGFAAAVGAQISSVSLLEALAMAGGAAAHPVCAVIRTGRREVCLQSFAAGLATVSAARIVTPDVLRKEINRITEEETTVVLEEGAGEILGEFAADDPVKLLPTGSLAIWVGRSALVSPAGSGDGDLIYLNTRFEIPGPGGRG